MTRSDEAIMDTVPSDPDREELLRAMERGEEPAAHEVLDRHRKRLRRMVASRMDRRLSSRFDPSDVVQETLIQAGSKLPRYLRGPWLPVYPWLRSLASERLLQLRRLHLRASKRAVGREEPGDATPGGAASVRLVDR